ncbi:uncharacterized protein THITE_2118580 [Thermothielavioides terrestris NRRL 8126]|uniref:Uncharacterized protein n=1 Tax=Thermothielavioides terrestris (strain ATCC 38088 / NRRL 8126) TaxID=578455 RepID=G2RAB8_THETT|nr:uncharacterized protein THITE_2118580 [Thermothielavioides terrestris NRRL 8126]AEO68850.1 hypothetical protein THITE_2118580 [Thermothielavioides terrestris NRRL 8126]
MHDDAFACAGVEIRNQARGRMTGIHWRDAAATGSLVGLGSSFLCTVSVGEAFVIAAARM